MPLSRRNLVPGHHQMHTLGRAHPEPAAAAGQSLQFVGPHAGGVDHHPAPHRGLLAGLHVPHRDPGDPVRFLDEADHLGRGAHHGAVLGRRPGHRQGVPGVVDLPVVVPHPADQRVPAQRRHQAQRAGPGQVLVPRHRAGPTHRVVHDQAATDVGPLDDVLGQRVEERHRLGQVRADLGEHQLAFVQRLADQPELEHLQVAQTAVEQLRRPGRGAGGDVAGLDQGHRETAGDGVQRGAGADHAAADDDHVERLGAQPEPGRRALRRAEL